MIDYTPRWSTAIVSTHVSNIRLTKQQNVCPISSPTTADTKIAGASSKGTVIIFLAEMGFVFFKQKTAYEVLIGLVGSEMCIRDSSRP